MTVKKITTAAQKGGVGKTTTGLNLARAAVVQGLRVLVVDADPQGNISSVAARERATTEDLDLADVIAPGSDVTMAEAIRPGVWDGLDVVAGSRKISIVRDQLTGMVAGREHRLREALATVEDDYDLILIDVGPNLDLITINALTASERVLIVTEPGLFAADGIAELQNTVRSVQQYFNPALQIAGVLVNRVQGTTSHDQFWIDEFSQSLDNVLQPAIPQHTWIKDAQEVPKGLDEWGTRKARAVADIYATHLDTIRRS
ncbi:AAA family ATPase [Curtobacterium sp. MCBD17_026]|uniref:ParA family protein n=1 Tax=Curtobacterium sp. MCBD17_026 TaxID=2175621 RepID=UPI000DAA681E|nr:AAA family ATPase [Curtobacterium sp. MCBD17_026]WIB72578.1 AAA family ATPase [Curtobacterium sp. MCBD17_026]